MISIVSDSEEKSAVSAESGKPRMRGWKGKRACDQERAVEGRESEREGERAWQSGRDGSFDRQRKMLVEWKIVKKACERA